MNDSDSLLSFLAHTCVYWKGNSCECDSMECDGRLEGNEECFIAAIDTEDPGEVV